MIDTGLRRALRSLHTRLEPPLSRAVLRLSRLLHLSVVDARATQYTAELGLAWTRFSWQNGLWRQNRWLGFPILQWPSDLLVLQELIAETRPRWIVETGTNEGGSSLFFASMLNLIGRPEGRVISVDVARRPDVEAAVRRHPLGDKIVFVCGDSAARKTLSQVEALLGEGAEALVFLDSDHSFAHVLAELRAYARFVPVGGYLCVFDTIMKDLWDLPAGSPNWRHDNPHRAVEAFLAENADFMIDRGRNRMAEGFAPDGFLRRIR